MTFVQQGGETLIHDGARWLAEVARVHSNDDTFDDPRSYPVPEGGYLGAVRNEYDTKTRTWFLNGPVWHTGQAIVAVLIAYRRSGEPALLDAAWAMGDYILRNIVTQPGHPNDGLMLSYEGDNVTANNQVTFETLPGLLDLAAVTGDSSYAIGARRAADFVLNGGFLADEGLIVDHYHVGEQRFVRDPDAVLPGRITLDDAALARLSDETGDPRYRDAFLAMAERALRDEDPRGTWIVYPPWHRDTGRLHIRASWWWGYPMLIAYDLTRDDRFWQMALRVGEFYLEQQNLDGGFPYAPLRDGRHGSFALATSGSAVSTIIWCDLYRRTHDGRYLDAIRRSLRFLFAARFSPDAEDEQVRGALWETLNVPDGSTTPGYRVRDIATIFAIRAMDRVLALDELADEELEPLSNAMPW